MDQHSPGLRNASFIALWLISVAISLAFLGTRNLYEDELTSFELITKPLPRLLHDANSRDVHPPGMYVLSKVAYSATRSERWMTLVPLGALYVGLTAFAYKTRSIIARSFEAYVLFLLLILLNPQVVLWGNSIRWYPYWTGIGLCVVALLLGPSGTTGKRVVVPFVCAFALAGMFYLNYLTIPFAMAIFGVLFIQFPRLRLGILAAGGLLVLMIVPQLFPFFRAHMHNAHGQTGASFVAGARFFHGLIISEAMMPWHWAGVAFCFLVAGPLLIRLGIKLRAVADRRVFIVASIFIFMCFIAIATGTGAKARSFILLSPLLGVLLARSCDTIKRAWLRRGVVVITAIWIGAGVFNMLARQGMAKTSLNDRPEEVVTLLQSQAREKPTVIFTHDPILTYEINRAAERNHQPWSVCSVYPDAIHRIASATPPAFEPQLVFVIRTYRGSLAVVNEDLDEAFADAESTVATPHHVQLSEDKDLVLKRHLPGVGALVGQLPRYRYDIQWGPAKPAIDWREVCHHFDLYHKAFGY